jgi:hypothetical protein
MVFFIDDLAALYDFPQESDAFFQAPLRMFLVDANHDVNRKRKNRRFLDSKRAGIISEGSSSSRSGTSMVSSPRPSLRPEVMGCRGEETVRHPSATCRHEQLRDAACLTAVSSPGTLRRAVTGEDMKNLPLNLVFLALALVALPARAGTITVDGFNNNTSATVNFNDGAGNSGTDNTLLTQFNVTFTSGGSSTTLNTFSIDLAHTVTAGQTYSVNTRQDLATAFTNGRRIAYIYQSFGQQDLTSDPVQAAAVQSALWDLSLNNHSPTSFGLDPDGTYSSGDENVFSVSFGSNPDSSQIAALVNQYLQASQGVSTAGGWFDASAAGNDTNRGVSVVQPVPEPSSFLLAILAVGSLATTLIRRPNYRN